ncbi:MAG: ABC transporter substrate-binding protein [Aestuariivita sp.]|nr:ABC transporter substrate-binding protein [Aestuariivita sp.]
MIVRSFFLRLTLLVFIIGLPTVTLSLDKSAAKLLINNLLNDINQVTTSKKSEVEVAQEFEDIFSRYSDTKYIASYVMGVDRRRATQEQKKSFSSAFKTYIARKYGKQFKGFVVDQLDIRDIREIKKWYEVDIIVKTKDGTPVKITFYVSNRTGRNLFFNMFVEGINLLLNERTEIGAILDKNRGNIDALIAELQKPG